MKGIGVLAAIGGLAVVAAVGPAVALTAGIATVAAGSATAGIGCVASNLTSQCTEGALMKPLVKAEEKTIAFFEKVDKQVKSGKLQLDPEPKQKLTDAKNEFKTESANFKKRIGLFVVGGIFLLSAGIILAASHGALAPVALKIAMLGVKHVSAGLVTASIATHTSIGVGLITGGASMHSKRVAELKKDPKSTESTPLLRRESK